MMNEYLQNVYLKTNVLDDISKNYSTIKANPVD